MKKLFLICLLALGLVNWARAWENTWENDGSIITNIPPQVDANQFINKGLFDIEYNSLSIATNGEITLSGIGFITSDFLPFLSYDTLYYTNRGQMLCDTGFNFENAPSGSTNAYSGIPTMATLFGNANIGQISAGSATNTFANGLTFFTISSFGIGGVSVPTLKIWASTVINSGLLDVGTSGYIGVTGNNLLLGRGTMHVEGFDDGLSTAFSTLSFNNFNVGVNPIGLFIDYWGDGSQTNVLSQANIFPPYAYSPLNNITNAAYWTFGTVFVDPATAFFNFTQDATGSNLYWQAVFVNTNLPGISTDVRFINGGDPFLGAFATPIIQWEAVTTNYSTYNGLTYTTNDLYLQDIYGSYMTNMLVTNSYTFNGAPLPQPYNFSWSRSYTGFTNLPHGDFPYSVSYFNNAFPATNAYATMGVTLAPVSYFPDPTLPGSTWSNLPGRIELTATNVLDLTQTQITGANYLNLNSGAHFVGSSNAFLDPPYLSMNLASTNGSLAISNLVPPTISRLRGTVDAYAARWTNVINGVTNRYHILIVNGQLAPTFNPQVLDCKLKSPSGNQNIFISDVLNIQDQLTVSGVSLTVTSNDVPSWIPPGIVPQYGEINIQTSQIIWSNSFQGILCLTNFGLISTENNIFLEGQTPYYTGNSITPYNFVVNHGLISGYGFLADANYFENTGDGLAVSNSSTGMMTTTNQSAVIYSGIGPIEIQVNGPALMLNGAIVAPSGDLTISATSMIITNHDLFTSGALTLSASAQLTDMNNTNNGWYSGDGMNLLVNPENGDLLGTTITNFSPAGVEVENVWAGQDRGANNAGFSNNAAIGHLILDGGNVHSQYHFIGPDGNKSAIYVDLLDLRDGATNRAPENGTEVFTAFDIDPNMTIYFADAVMDGTIDISEKLAATSNGRLVWVPTYAGFYSSTNMATITPGVTVRANRALATSTDIDSSGTGVYNAYNPTPFYVSQNVGLKLSFTNKPAKTPMLKWNGLLNSTNIVYYRNSLISPWSAIATNVCATNGQMTFIDSGRTNTSGFYRVQVQPH